MPDIITDRFSEKQKQINQWKAETSARYLELWSRMIAEWNSPGPDDRVWLMYSANYLFRTNNIRWAIDPLTFGWRVKYAPKVNALASDLKNISFALLTHSHPDHLDLELLSSLRHLPITWVVPEFLLPLVIEKARLPRERMIPCLPLRPIQINGIDILPFDGLHLEITTEGGSKGVPSMGYLVECNGARWLFPGDTRSYDPFQLPAFGAVDVVFAHLWLGRASALADPPPLLEAFCQFHLQTGARHVILSHLHEFGRDAYDYWDDAHVQRVCSRLQELSAGVSVSFPKMGNGTLL